MLLALIGPRLHGILDDAVAAFYVVGAYLLGLRGFARAAALAGAIFHFLLTRFTNYPQGTWKVIPFRVHAFLEVGEGLAVLAVAGLAPSPAPLGRAFLAVMGASQLGAFAFSDYGPPGRTPERPPAADS